MNRRTSSESLGEGWAVRFRLRDGGTAWLNPTGGYVSTRYGRAVWGNYDDALDASHEWDARDPVIVRIVFKRKRQQT